MISTSHFELKAYQYLGPCAGLVFVAACYAVKYSPAGLVLLAWVVSFVLIALAIVSYAAMIVIGLLRRQSIVRQAISLVVTAGLLAAVPSMMNVIDHARFTILRAHYDAAVNAAGKGSDKPIIAPFYWGSSGILLTSVDTYVVFDETDEIALPEQSRSALWKRRAPAELAGSGSGCTPGDVRKFASHYYLASMICPGE